MNAYHRKLRQSWKRHDQKQKTRENKRAKEVAERLLGDDVQFANGDRYRRSDYNWFYLGRDCAP